MDESGHMLMKLVEVKIPKKYNLDEPEICSECGSITVAGIFTVVDEKDCLSMSSFQPDSAGSDLTEYGEGEYGADEDALELDWPED
jgi:hypothetical protein